MFAMPRFRYVCHRSLSCVAAFICCSSQARRSAGQLASLVLCQLPHVGGGCTAHPSHGGLGLVGFGNATPAGFTIMLTCPHCQQSFEGPAGSASDTTSRSVPPTCCCTAAPAAPFLRLFAGSGGIVVKNTSSTPHLQLSIQPHATGLQEPFSPTLQIVWPRPSPATINRHSASIIATRKALVKSGWYYKAFSGEESLIALKNCPPGTFLVRDSSDPEHLFSLSVQTTRGPTSVRLRYLDGEFRLDAQHHLAHHVPRFDCVLKLVEHYVQEGKETQRRLANRKYVNVLPTPEPGSQVWVDDSGRMHSPILLTQPLRCRVSTLQHLARLAINQRLQSRDLPALKLPKTTEDYLREYPYRQ
ncbi:suppressor of cytokine signaling 3-like isoform X1 [Cloeon dipterum]|uniref:suppressor of cytokine signaling 3-like isoform X1 n=2 Tax=Cloeon dipterum TaxID=197152 RepID=UPI00321FDCD8